MDISVITGNIVFRRYKPSRVFSRIDENIVTVLFNGDKFPFDIGFDVQTIRSQSKIGEIGKVECLIENVITYISVKIGFYVGRLTSKHVL